jgi:hypothetical protein
MSELTTDNPKAPKRSSKRKPAMEPLGWDEIVSQPGMGGYLSFLNGPIPLPHLQPPIPEPTVDPVVNSIPVSIIDPAVVATAEAATNPDVVSGSDVITDSEVVANSDVVSTPEIVPRPGAALAPAVVPETETESSPAPATAPVSAQTPKRRQAPVVISTPVFLPMPGDDTTTGRRPRIRKCAAAHDGHSLGEEVLYQALWKAATVESAGARTIVIGWRGMSQLCRMTPKNCKINAQRLIRKLALEVLSPYNTPESIGTTYRIFPTEAILRRRRTAGMEWVIRSRGVEFVDPATGIPVTAQLCGYVSG